MGVPLSPPVQRFLGEKVIAHLATLMKDGSPQVTPLWVETDGESILINTAAGRLKARNMERDGRVGLSIMGLQNPNRALYVRGKVTEITTEGAKEQIDRLAAKYIGSSQYKLRPGEQRLKVVIEPIRVSARGV